MELEITDDTIDNFDCEVGVQPHNWVWAIVKFDFQLWNRYHEYLFFAFDPNFDDFVSPIALWFIVTFMCEVHNHFIRFFLLLSWLSFSFTSCGAHPHRSTPWFFEDSLNPEAIRGLTDCEFNSDLKRRAYVIVHPNGVHPVTKLVEFEDRQPELTFRGFRYFSRKEGPTCWIQRWFRRNRHDRSKSICVVCWCSWLWLRCHFWRTESKW